MKQKIQFTGKNLNEIFLAKYPMTVRTGDILVEQDDGSWRVEKGGAK